MNAMNRPVCMIIGVGPGNGIAFANRFSKEGYSVALCARDVQRVEALSKDISNSYVFKYDVTEAECHKKVFNEVKETLGPISVLIYNAGSGDFKNIDETSLESFQNAWEVNTKGLFLSVKEVVQDMREQDFGNIVVIGATASWRGAAFTAPFASAKAAQRSLAQSMSKHLGRENIHVSYVIIDGVIGSEKARKRMKDKDDSFFMKADDIAESVYFLTRQPKSAWTFELDLRPFGEKW